MSDLQKIFDFYLYSKVVSSWPICAISLIQHIQHIEHFLMDFEGDVGSSLTPFTFSQSLLAESVWPPQSE
jgi:hypothetical protein